MKNQEAKQTENQAENVKKAKETICILKDSELTKIQSLLQTLPISSLGTVEEVFNVINSNIEKE